MSQQPEDGPATTPTTDGKRKADDNSSGNPTRPKRNRYISIACNECKRRKIKCNGQVPCQRCGHLNLECRYAPNCCNNNFKDSEEFQTVKHQITALQEQVNALFTNLTALRAHEAYSPTFDTYSHHHASHHHHSQQPPFTPIPAGPGPGPGPGPSPSPKLPRFRGPTSSAFNFDVAKSSLHNMGIAPMEDGLADDATTVQDSPGMSSPPRVNSATTTTAAATAAAAAAPMACTMHPTKDPIWAIKREEAMRLLGVYEEEIGIIHPIVDIGEVTEQTGMLYTFMEAAVRTGLAQRVLPGSDGLQDDNTAILKMILATTLMVEGNGQSELGQRLFASVRPVLDSKFWGPLDIRAVKLFALAATYYFQMDDDIMAYRVIGVAARLCLEMGVHRRAALIASYPEDRHWRDHVKTFWVIYILDRRWSLSTGLPFVIQDEDIDPNLPEPDESLPYLRCMVSYNRINSKLWYSGLGSEGTPEIRRDEIGYLDYQVLQWYRQVPDDLQFYPPDSLIQPESANRGLRRLRVILYLRMNQLRILIYRPVLHSATSIARNKSDAQTVIDIAKDTVRLLTQLNQTSDIYRAQQMCFHYFLVTALAVLFLAVCHAPAEFNRQVRDEFYMALDLINGFSTKSYVSKRLWNTIKNLRQLAEKMGILARPLASAVSSSDDAHSTAAVAMAGLAGHPMEDLSVHGAGAGAGAGAAVNGDTELGNSPMNAFQMSHELTNLFEAVGGVGQFLVPPGATTAAGTTHPDGGGIDALVVPEGGLHHAHAHGGYTSVFGNEGELSRAVKELF